MVQFRTILQTTALLLLGFFPGALAHIHDEQGVGTVGGGVIVTAVPPYAMPSVTVNATVSAAPESYVTYPAFGGLMLGHIITMTVAWFFMLPICQSKRFASVIALINVCGFRHYAEYRSIQTCTSGSTLLP